MLLLADRFTSIPANIAPSFRSSTLIPPFPSVQSGRKLSFLMALCPKLTRAYRSSGLSSGLSSPNTSPLYQSFFRHVLAAQQTQLLDWSATIIDPMLMQATRYRHRHRATHCSQPCALLRTTCSLTHRSWRAVAWSTTWTTMKEGACSTHLYSFEGAQTVIVTHVSQS